MRNEDTRAFSGNAISELASGKQFEIRLGEMRAVVTEMGAGLRVFEVNGHEFLDTYSEDEPLPYSRGQVLLPWPNRIDQGIYEFNGSKHVLGLNDTNRENAIHGLTRWMNWQVIQHESDSLVMSLILHAQDGYPFVLSLQQSYRLSARGLEMETLAHNVGSRPLPYGAGHHPYLTVGTELVNSALLELPASSYFLTNERMIPQLPARSVAGTAYDFRTRRAIGDVVMDTGFTDLIPESDGYSRIRLCAPEGSPSITVFMDATYQYVQLYTGDNLPALAKRRRGIAIEPYTCASDAFNNGLGLIILQPGESFKSVWGMSVEN